jgi:PAS domain S-box-containing protein
LTAKPSPAAPDFRVLFESAPALYLVLAPDLTILAATDAYAEATMTRREAIVGRNLFEVLPDNPADPSASGVANLRASLDRVLLLKQPDAMPIERYDIRRPAALGDGVEERYWSPLNLPVLGADGEIRWIIHRIADVTHLMRPGSDASMRDAASGEADAAAQLRAQTEELRRATDALRAEVAERRRAEERLRFLQSASVAIAEAKDFDAALQVVLRLVCEAADWAYGEAFVPDAAGTKLTCAAHWYRDDARLRHFAAHSRGIVYRRGEGIGGKVWDTGQPIWVNDVSVLERGHPERVPLVRQVGIQSIYVLPIQRGGEVLAVLQFVMLEKRQHDAGMVESIGAVAAQLGAAFQRKRIEESLRSNARLLEAALDVAQLGSWVSDPVSQTNLQWSREMFRIFGLDEAEFDHKVATIFEMIHPEDRAAVAVARHRAMERDEPFSLEHRILRRDGSVRWVHQRAAILRDAIGVPVQMLGVVQDVTELRLIQQQLVQAQKMEAIGNLTGGLAHDFNNLLGIIIGNLDLLRPRLAGDPLSTELVTDALDGATRGADLTRRLLAFARRQPLQAERIEVNELVSGMVRLLSRTLGEAVEIALDLSPEVWPVVVDPTQLEASIANLATNARDAMPTGGKLMIATKNAHLDAEYAAQHHDVASGDYVMIEVSDTGAGMTPEVTSRIFEPFFTTKPQGKGTGLGLSMVFGFMKQSGGHITVYSEPGVGTTLRLYLPRAMPGAVAGPRERGAIAMGKGETILAVEDNAGLRRVVVRQLRKLGYRVLEAENAAAALEVLDREKVDLLFSDVVMPGEADGYALARQALERWPRLKVVMTSGFPAAKINGDREESSMFFLLSKPYRQEELARMLRDALDAL